MNARLRAIGRALRWPFYLPPARKTTFRGRLLPWPLYAGLGLVLLAFLPLLFADRLDVQHSRQVGLVLIPLIMVMLLLSFVSWRSAQQRRDE